MFNYIFFSESLGFSTTLFLLIILYSRHSSCSHKFFRFQLLMSRRKDEDPSNLGYLITPARDLVENFTIDIRKVRIVFLVI